MLRSLYEKYDARLLEANVRSYLSIQSKVNKGMFTTLKEHPEDFLAFNNGIVIVAEQLQLSRTSIGTTGIKVLGGHQNREWRADFGRPFSSASAVTGLSICHISGFRQRLLC